MTRNGHGNENRDSAGVTVTMRRRDTDEPVTIYRGGRIKVALASVVELFDPAEWYVGCISTPRTILSDLRGRLTVYVERDTKRRLLDGSTRIERPQETLGSRPERTVLASIGQTEYLR